MARLLTHRLQQIQLLVEPFRPQSNSRFYDLGQPFGAMTRGMVVPSVIANNESDLLGAASELLLSFTEENTTAWHAK